MSDIIFLGTPPPLDMRIIRVGRELWFRHPMTNEFVRQSFCASFQDGTPRPPWLDREFKKNWDAKGPDFARNSQNYDLSELTTFLEMEAAADA